MKSHQLKRSTGLKNKTKQRGRGNGTGTGNYSGRGLKGQKARSGHSMKSFFEGGQTSIIQRLPKARGFTRPFKLVKHVVVINLGTLDQDKRISDTMEITKAQLKTLGYIKNESLVVKVLGDGDYNKHLTFTGIEFFSKSAQEKLAAPGATKTGKVKLQSIVKGAKPVKKVKTVKSVKEDKPVKKVAAAKVAAKPLLEVEGSEEAPKKKGRPKKVAE